MDNLIGQSIGRYHIVERLGEGGMATVYKSYDTRLERDVAIKVIRVDQFAPAVLERMLMRFEREAKTLARLSHPNIVKLYDYGEHDGSPYLVMEYIPGGTLKLRTAAPMPWQEAVCLLLPVAHALSYAHEENVIHRDIKPANILLTLQGLPMLSDFGVAKILDVEAGSTLTGTNVGIGTPEYMAPEQWMNKVSPQTDIYALGIVLFELVTGQKPYTADTPAAVLLKQASDPLPRPRAIIPDLSDEVERVLFKALAKKPEERYASMTEFSAALDSLSAKVQPIAAISENAIDAGTILYPARVKENENAVRIPPPLLDRTEEEVKPGVDMNEAPLERRSIPVWGWGLAGVVGLGVIVLIVMASGGTGSVSITTPTSSILMESAILEPQPSTPPWVLSPITDIPIVAETIEPTFTQIITATLTSTVAPPIAVGTIRVTSEQVWVTVRSGPGIIFQSLGRVNGGEVLYAIGEAFYWVQIQYPSNPDDGTAWILSSYTDYDPASKTLPQITDLPPTPILPE